MKLRTLYSENHAQSNHRISKLSIVKLCDLALTASCDPSYLYFYAMLQNNFDQLDFKLKCGFLYFSNIGPKTLPSLVAFLLSQFPPFYFARLYLPLTSLVQV